MKRIGIGILITSLIVGVLPLLSVVTAGFLSTIFGCALNEGDTSMCPTVFGDIGELLYTMGVFGWFLFYTIPLGMIGILIGGIVITIGVLRDKKHS